MSPRIPLLCCWLLAMHLSATAQEAPLFSSNDPLDLSIRGDLRRLLDDRQDNAPQRPAWLAYTGPADQPMQIPVSLRTRGHFRRTQGGCSFPPLLITFDSTRDQSDPLFSGQRKLKLVMPCRGDEYVLREWMAYRIYNLITPMSFRARLVRLQLNDTVRKKAGKPFYAMLLEEDRAMAARNQRPLIDQKGLRPENLEHDQFFVTAVFEYLIGNTDWSVQFLQNMKLLSGNPPLGVPYDFDQAGIVDAPYALPAEELRMNSVRERRYRGYCVQDMKLFDPAVAQFNALRDSIYALYRESTLLDPGYIKRTLAYLDEFYNTLNNPAKRKEAFQYPCDPNGTGNVVIHGLGKD